MKRYRDKTIPDHLERDAEATKALGDAYMLIHKVLRIVDNVTQYAKETQSTESAETVNGEAVKIYVFGNEMLGKIQNMVYMFDPIVF